MLDRVIKLSEQTFPVVNYISVVPENSCHHYTKCAVPSTLLSAYKYDNCPRCLVWILHSPSEPHHHVFEFSFVAAANHVEDVL